MDISKKNILIAGMGKSGESVKEVLLNYGCKISVYDKKALDTFDNTTIQEVTDGKIRGYFGGIEPDEIEKFDLIILSPGLPLEIPFIKKAKEINIEIIGEIELAYRLGKGKYVGITGTNGKTTTASLTYEIFKSSGKKSELVGNIGTPLISKSTKTDDETWLITEISSFQLETIRDFCSEVSVLLNISEDHLDRHVTMENYSHEKSKIFLNQNSAQYFVVNADDMLAYAQTKKCMARIVPFSRQRELDFGCFVKEGKIVVKDNEKIIEIIEVSNVKMPGNHNLDNALAATAIAYFSGIDVKYIANALENFKGVEHRIEFVKEINKVKFINDSKGTNPNASIKAIEAIKEPIILIAGGYDKGAVFEDFVNGFNKKVKHMVLIGKTAKQIKDTATALGFDKISMAANMEEAVEMAYSKAIAWDTVLLSPACASWDMYNSFEERGNDFKACVKKLI